MYWCCRICYKERRQIVLTKQEKVKEDICEIGRRMYAKGFTASNDGNISVRISDDEIWTTPTGVSKGFMTPDMLVRVNSNGEILEGNRNPSSEVKMHLRVYQNRKDIHAVVHAHPPLATAFAVCRMPLDKSYVPEGIVGLGPVPVTEYATPSTEEVPKSIEPFLEGNVLLLANHGALTWDIDIFSAYYKMEVVEYLAQLNMNVQAIGKGVELPDSEVEKLIGMRSYYKELAKKK
jgi:L-fuculose-phosphate aldolase